MKVWGNINFSFLETLFASMQCEFIGGNVISDISLLKSIYFFKILFYFHGAFYESEALWHMLQKRKLYFITSDTN